MKYKGLTGLLALSLFFLYGQVVEGIVPYLSCISPVYYEMAPLQVPARPMELHLVQNYFSHRGDSASHVEHTFAAYDAAIEKGSQYIEQDLVLSKDGTLYVSHDMNGKRVFGDSRKFSSLTDAEIDELRNGEGEAPHTLKSVFDRYGKAVTYIVEVRPGMADAFIRIVKQEKMEDNVIVQSKSLKDLDLFKQTFPDMPTLYLAMNLEDAAVGLPDMSVDIICMNKKWNTTQMAEWVHSYGKLFSVWILNTEEEIRQAETVGVDVFFTDDTGLAEKMTKGELQ